MAESMAASPVRADEEQGRNGGDPGAPNGVRETAGSLLSRLASPVLTRLRDRLRSDLDDRDPDFIREELPFAWLMSSIWFRGDVKGLDKVPENKAVLLVGNHSGGNMTPDTVVFTLAFNTYFGVERPFYQLAHNLVLASPYGQYLRKFGTVAASHENARKALDADAAVLVYPGGDWEVHRPSWRTNRIDFNGRKGFIRLALDAGVPIVPVVSVGGQETSIFLSNGERLARTLRLDKLFRLKVLPVSLALPWLINIGDFFGHIPLPAKISVQVLDPIDLRKTYGRTPDIDEAYEHITTLMQDTLSAMAAERRFPVLG